MARTCRHFGISRNTFFKWKTRLKADGAAVVCDRPRAPRRSLKATPRPAISKILSRIADYLKRFHDIRIALSSVHRILAKHGMNRLPANQKHGRTLSDVLCGAAVGMSSGWTVVGRHGRSQFALTPVPVRRGMMVALKSKAATSQIR